MHGGADGFALGGAAGTVGTLGHITPLSQNNSQSSEDVGSNVGTSGTVGKLSRPMNPWRLVSNARWPPPKIGDEYRDGASDLPIEIRNSASSVAPNGSRTNQHHSTGSSPVPPNNHPRV